MRQCECKNFLGAQPIDADGMLHCGTCGYPFKPDTQQTVRGYLERRRFPLAGRVVELAGIVQHVPVREFLMTARPRRHGKTTQQMIGAPQGAYFIWTHGPLDYPKELAHSLGRDDLRIVRLDWLIRRDYLGVDPSGIVVDHAVELSVRHQVNLDEANRRVKGGSHAKGPKARS